MNSESDLGSLKRRRTTLKASCTRVKTHVDSITSVTPVVTAQLEERKSKLKQFWNDYNDVQTQLESLDEAEANDRAEFEEAFFDLSSRIRALTLRPSTTRGVDTPSPTGSIAYDSTVNVRLPKLDLPKFSGKYDEWFPFHDAFHSVIHANLSLIVSNIHKLQYLRAATTDDAHKVISSLKISDDNYAVAWNLLKERYDNKRIIVQNHLKAIVELPAMNKENASELRQIADGAARHIQALKALKRPTHNPQFNVSSGIDVLIGTEVLWSLMCIGQIKASDKHPTLQKTRLGWILAGKLSNCISRSQRVTSLCASVSNIELNKQFTNFWKMEDVRSSSKTYTLKENLCEQHFVKTTFRDNKSKYVVQLPLKQQSVHSLGMSRDIALNRLRSLERRFDKDPSLKLRYSNFIHEYIDLGHMRQIVEQDPNETGTYYMPYHCVLKEDAKRTKLRVVFDASCKTDSGLSLNDVMMVGPVIQDDFISVLLRFRTYRYVLVADIIKMYRQILIHPSQTKLQRILWRDDKTSDVQTFELATVTYGTAAASYLATRCLLDLAERYANEFPLGSLHLKRNFYVDDLLTGADSKSEALAIRDQLIDKVKSSIDTTDMRVLLWSDSTIALNWINSHSRRWSTIVANRVGEIQRLTERSNWRHVKSSDNPADFLSRGLLPNELVNLELWWHGPSYLTLPEHDWPSGEFKVLTGGVSE
ncbi:uncharacterized protein [Temnothorax longispinosus]|uniref:uncharacterized protein n=1 Tax=Temnothorax longispinosus TaxID=300112 RepID=UPI003A98FC80